MNIEQIAEKIYEVIYAVLMFVKGKVAVLLDFGNAGALPKESLGVVAAIVVFAAIMLLLFYELNQFLQEKLLMKQ